MPRPNSERTIMVERSLATRIAYERNKRGLTYEALAQQLTDLGCPVQPSAIQKIEKSGRRIVVDEAVAFAAAFEMGLEELLIPLDARRDLQFLQDLDRGPTLRVARDAAVADYEALLERVRTALSEGDVGESLERQMHERLRVVSGDSTSSRALFRADVLEWRNEIDAVRRYYERHMGPNGDGVYPAFNDDDDD